MLSTEALGARRTRGRALDDRLASTLRYYEANARDYAAATSRIDTSERISQFIALLPPVARVLDVGCGAGRDLSQFLSSGVQAVGLDLSPNLAEIARRQSGCEVIVGDLLAPPRMTPFDGVWAMASLLHIERARIGEALASLASMLKPGGALFASVKRGTGEVVDDTGRWFTLYDEAQWASNLREASFDIVEITGEPPVDGSATGTVAPGWISSLARRL